MSQVPPSQPPFPQQPYGQQPQPPYGQQPYGQPPPGGAGGAYTMPPQRKTSGAAVTSLIMGILGCVPFITGLLAILFGILGIKATSDPRYSGRPLAVIGLILGILSVGVWGLFGGGIYAAVAYTRPAREAARQFAVDVAAGNVDAAHARTSGVSREEVAKAADAVKGWGALQDTTMPVAVRNTVNGVDTAQVAGVATFATAGRVPYAVRFVKQGGELKVTGFELVAPGQGAVSGGTTPDVSQGGSRIGD